MGTANIRTNGPQAESYRLLGSSMAGKEHPTTAIHEAPDRALGSPG